MIHSAAHNWEDQGGHLGEHGSLGIVQARAPLVIAGKGVRNARRRPARGPARRRRADDRRAARLRAARRRHATSRCRTATSLDDVLDRSSRPQPRRRLPVRRHQPQRALRHGRARRGAERRAAHRDGHRVRARRDGVAADGHAREPHVDPHRRAPRPPRHPQQRVVRPRDRRAGHHQLAGDVAVAHGAPRARHRVDPRRGAPHLARRVHRVGQRAVRHRRRLLDVRLLPPGRGPADPEATRSACRTRPSASCARRRTTRGRRSSTTWASTRRSASSAGHYRDVDYPLPRFMWCNFTLTDAAMHEGGPHSEIAAASVRDSDGRLGEVLAAVEQRRRVRRHRVRARRRPRHGGERPGVPRRLGRRAARGRARVPRRGLRLPLLRQSDRASTLAIALRSSSSRSLGSRRVWRSTTTTSAAACRDDRREPGRNGDRPRRRTRRRRMTSPTLSKTSGRRESSRSPTTTRQRRTFTIAQDGTSKRVVTDGDDEGHRHRRRHDRLRQHRHDADVLDVPERRRQPS